MSSASLKKKMRANGATIIAVWTAFILLLAAATLHKHHLDVLKEAENEARNYFRLTLSYRIWVTRLGGVYAPADKAAPNQFLISRRRDVTTDDGQQLTLINASYMTRMVFEDIKASSATPVVSKITGLNPLNPSNAPDTWERAALAAFSRGESAEMSQVTSLNGKPYLRFIGSYVTEQSCLECHSFQGYRNGDVQGGLVISIPLAGYFASEAKIKRDLVAGYLLLWVVGSVGIAVSSRRRFAYEEDLRASEEKFRTVCDWTQDWEYWSDQRGAMKYISPSCLEMTGYPPSAFLDDPELVSRLVHPEDQEAFLDHLKLSLPAEHPSVSLEFRIITRDGAVRWMHHACRSVFSDGLYLGRRVSNRDVTDRKLGERELAIHAELLNSVSDSVLVIDRRGRILDANETAWRSRGFSREELLSMSIVELSSAGEGASIEKLFLLSFNNERAFFEAKHRLKDGGAITVEIDTRVIDYRGEQAILSCIRDITQRKRTEESLRRSERFNVSLHRISVFLTSRSDAEMYSELLTTLLEITESPCGMAGYLDDTGALVCPSLVGAADQGRVQRTGMVFPVRNWKGSIWGETLLRGRAQYTNSPQQVPDGHFPVERCLAVPLVSQGRSIGLFMVANCARDYSDDDLDMLSAIACQVAPVLQARIEQQQAAAALRENESRLRVIFDVIQAGIIQVDAAGFVTFANQRMAEMLGLSMEELLGSTYRSHVCPDHLDHCDMNLRLLMDGEVDYVHLERHYLRKDGTSFWGYLSGRRLTSTDLDRPHTLLVGTIADMTELKTAEEKRHRSEQQMLHVQKLESLGVLAGGIAHDFNNILLAIMGNTSLALHRIPPGSDVERHLQQIAGAAEKAADLARQMLAYSGKGRFVLEALDLNLLVSEMAGMLEVSISKKASVRFELAPQLPCIVADPTQVRQIVMNLAINASEAIGEGSGVISITTGCLDCDRSYLAETWLNDELPAGRYVFLEVADTGCGMDPSTVERIFEPFFTTKFTGRGLGMAAILGIVRGHKGAIKVYSEPGKGSSFKVFFPASDRAIEVIPAEGTDDGWRGEGRVLLVDDEETVRSVGSEMLRELGFTVETAADGREALQLYRLGQGEFALVLMDLNMPHLNGEEAFHELRRIDPQVRVVLSSGFSEQEVTRNFLGKGLAGFVQKPYTLDILRDALSRLLY